MLKTLITCHLVQVVWIKIYLLLTRATVATFSTFKVVGIFNDREVHDKVPFVHLQGLEP